MTNIDKNEQGETVPVAADAFTESLLNGRHIASLATQRADGSIHLTAVWFLFHNGYLYFPTNSRSQKVRNVESNPFASAMIDTREPGQEQGVSVSGTAKVIHGERAIELVSLAQQRYLTEVALADPDVGPSYAELDDVVVALTPTRWMTWDIAKANAVQFGGKLAVETGYLHPRD